MANPSTDAKSCVSIPARHVHQFNQLRRLDPVAYRAAATALRVGLPALAGQIVVNGMHRTFTRLAAPPACPEAVQKNPQGRTRCDAYHPNPNPDGRKHIRCRKIARYTLVLRNTGGGAFYQVQRCQACRDELVTSAAAPDAKFVILAEAGDPFADQPLPDRPTAEYQRTQHCVPLGSVLSQELARRKEAGR